MSRDDLKTAKRVLRTYAIKLLVGLISLVSVRSLFKLKNLLLKALRLVFKRAIKRSKQLLPPEFKQNADEIIAKMCENHILSLLEVIFYDKLEASDPSYITIKGEARLKEAQKKGRGVIILTAHFGSFELVAYTLAKLGYDIYAMARPQSTAQMTDFINKFRTERGVKVVLDNLLFNSLKVLRKNGCIGLLCDLNAKRHGYICRFFGRNASFYPMPVLLALRTGASVIPTFIERQADGRHILRFEKPLSFCRQNTMNENIKIFVERYEAAIRARPDLWCWFHERYVGTEKAKTR